MYCAVTALTASFDLDRVLDLGLGDGVSHGRTAFPDQTDAAYGVGTTPRRGRWALAHLGLILRMIKGVIMREMSPRAAVPIAPYSGRANALWCLGLPWLTPSPNPR
jgi:hypothetical protein